MRLRLRMLKLASNGVDIDNFNTYDISQMTIDEKNEFGKMLEDLCLSLTYHFLNKSDYVFYNTSQDEVVESISRDVMTSVLSNLHQFQGEVKFSVWVAKYVSNEINTYWQSIDEKKIKGVPTTLTQTNEDGEEYEFIPSNQDVESEAIANTYLDMALSQLSEKERNIFLWTQKGYKSKDIGKFYGVTDSAIRQIYHRIKDKMQEYYHSMGVDF